MSHLQPDEQA